MWAEMNLDFQLLYPPAGIWMHIDRPPMHHLIYFRSFYFLFVLFCFTQKRGRVCSDLFDGSRYAAFEQLGPGCYSPFSLILKGSTIINSISPTIKLKWLKLYRKKTSLSYLSLASALSILLLFSYRDFQLIKCTSLQFKLENSLKWFYHPGPS